MHRSVRCVAIAASLAAFAVPARAVPRYTARFRQSCNLCHQNPAGGGLRSLYASQYLAPTELAFRAWSPERIARIRPDVSESITLGTDVRTIHVYADEEPTQNFFQMQADVYAAFQADDRWSAVVELDATKTQNTYEVYALGYVLPHTGYVKVGRFTPLFGWKFDDHNMFVREALGFDQPRNTDAGIEIGFLPPNGMLSFGAFNGNRSSTFFDADRNLAYTATAGWRWRAGPVDVGAGASYQRNNRDPAGERSAGGPHGFLHWGRLAWLWEVDGMRLLPLGRSETLDGLVTSHEVSWALCRGIDVVATYNFLDPDIDRKSGARTRLGLGLDVVATPCVNVTVRANNFQIEPGTDVSGRNHWRSELLLHLFY